MRSRFELFYRYLLVLLAVGLFWSVWVSRSGLTAAEAAATNVVGAAATGTNAVAGAPSGEKKPEHLGINLLPTIDRQYLTFGLDRVEFLQRHQPFGIALWQYLASFLFIFLAFYVAKFLDFAARVWLKRWAERTETRADDMLLELAHGPVKVVVFVILLHIGLSVFTWPPTVERWISNALKIVVALSLTYAILKVVDVVIGAWRQRRSDEESAGFDQQLAPILRKAIKATVVVVATLVTLDNVGVNITGLVASLSIGGLALGLAAQDTVANLFGAVAVLVDKPFDIGDRVKFESVEGVVESIGLRSTRIRNLDGHLITVPNKTMGNATITNITKRPTIRTVMNFGLAYDSTPARITRATELLKEIYGANPGTKEVTVAFDRFGDFSLNLLVVHVWKDADHPAYLAGLHAMNLEVKRRFDAERIDLAFPTQTLLVKSVGAVAPTVSTPAAGAGTA